MAAHAMLQQHCGCNMFVCGLAMAAHAMLQQHCGCNMFVCIQI